MSRKKKFRFNLIVLIVLIILLLESLIANIINRTYAASIPQKYDLRSEIPIVVKNQYQNEACVYMSRSTSLETHVKLGQKNGKYSFFKETPVFSVLTSKKAGQYVSVSIDRTEKVLKEIYNDNNKTEDEILKIQGEYTSEKIKKALEKLQPSFDTTVDGKRSSSNLVTYKVLPSIIKEYDNNNIVYKNSDKNVISKTEVDEIRSQYKRFIMENGGLICSVQTNGFKDGLNGDKVCFNKEKTTSVGNHSVTIIGWDDTYSKNNFPESNRPNTDGAYLVQNSWGSEWGKDGTFYVSYDDIYIEMAISGIDGITEYKDVTEPDISIDNETSNNIKVSITDKYSSGINEKSLKYKWTDHNIEPDINDSDWMPIKDGQEIENKKEKYLWIYGEDNAGNFTLYSSGENEIGLMIDDIESKCDKWMNKDIQLTVKSTMTLFNINESFEIFMMSSSFSQEELKKMEKIQDNNDHLLTIDKEGKHTIYLTKLKDGKECRAMKLDIWIDKTKPTAPEILISDNKENDKYYEGAVVTIEDGKDDLSGVKETNIEIKDKDGKNVDVSDKTKFKLSNLGIYTVKATTFDNAGNSSSTEKKVEIIKKEDNSKSDNNSNNNQDDSKSDNNGAGNQDNSKSDNSKLDGTKKENNGNIINSSLKINSEISSNDNKKQQNNSNQSNKILPATGANNEYSLIIISATIIFMILTIHSYRKMKEIE
ncbi:MAG TPA: hypothetical protein OIM49_03935 [Clostridiaceae bacterium]|jgi:peptidase C1A papain|nr:hypothetical protein [Clostridiaceae bacterium]